MSSPGNVGAKIAEHAGVEGARVDASECQEQWWTETYEPSEEQESRVQALWDRLAQGCADGPHIVVSHSNLIIGLARLAAGQRCCRFDGSVEVSESGEWDFQVLPRLPADLARARSTKLRNCGVLGLRCSGGAGLETPWAVEDAMLMFGSSFEDRVGQDDDD